MGDVGSLSLFFHAPFLKPMRRYLLRSYQSDLILKPDIEESRDDEALVKKNRFGIYLNIYHTLDPSGVVDLEKKYQLFDLIIKYMVVYLPDDELERALDREDSEEGEKAAAHENADDNNDES